MPLRTHTARSRRHRALHSAAPVVAAILAASAFALGAFAFEAGAARASGEGAWVSEPMPPENITASIEPASVAAEPAPVPETLPGRPDGPVIALLIDDAGPDRALTRRALALPARLTVSILPYAEDAPQLAEAARAAGHEIFLHLPMEPGGLADPGPHALTRHHTPEELLARTEWAMARVPGAAGLNNHMGSALTADRERMTIILGSAARAGLIFVDSLTSPRSRARDAARGLGMTAFRRDIFIDHESDPERIAERLSEIEALALREGRVIAIGHPRPATLAALEAWIPQAQARGFQFVAVTSLVQVSDETARLGGGAQ